ncbi:LNS2-domain-containing protein, partial [Calocera viscosa TUFC12733]
MNYIRGAYQYYRDLPPINAATLTGAIDVIVIERPADPSAGPGETSLACTPFHVRFGKLSILRPADNQVTVVVNGQVTQFSMKIGEAGEAFFVCETDEDVPQELQTSPIIHASEPLQQVNEEPKTDRFGAKAREEGMKEVEQMEGTDPPFLDLNNEAPPEAHSPSLPSTSRPTTPTSRSSTPPTSLSASSHQEKQSKRSSSQPPPASEAEHPNPSKAVDRIAQPSSADHPGPDVEYKSDYITRDDSSPLFPALASWRLEAAPADLTSGSPERQPSPPASLSRASTSSWTRWWSRRPQDAVSKAGDLEPAKPSELQLPGEKPKTYAKTLRLTSEQLKQLHLKPGPNSVSFSLANAAAVVCTARIFLWKNTDQLVVSDIDGTITKSDALGHMFTMIGRDWTHSGVAKLYTDICRNGYKIMYLTSRAIGQADSTRDYLKGINQNNYQLPEGPVIMSPDRLIAALHRCVIMRKPEVFKMACLRDIQRLFGDKNKHPFYAGFGNRITDALSYRSVNIPSGRIFTIDSSGVVKMELLELAGYKSSYIHMTDLVDQMFPPVHRKWAQEFTDLNYWRTPM